jgi:hypothetical protein
VVPSHQAGVICWLLVSGHICFKCFPSIYTESHCEPQPALWPVSQAGSHLLQRPQRGILWVCWRVEETNRATELSEPRTLPASFTAFRPCPAVNHPTGGRRLGKSSDPHGLGSELLVPPGSKPNMPGRQLQKSSGSLAKGLRF